MLAGVGKTQHFQEALLWIKQLITWERETAFFPVQYRFYSCTVSCCTGTWLGVDQSWFTREWVLVWYHYFCYQKKFSSRLSAIHHRLPCIWSVCVHICHFKDRFAFFTGVPVIQLLSMSCVLEPCFHCGGGKLRRESSAKERPTYPVLPWDRQATSWIQSHFLSFWQSKPDLLGALGS